MSDCKPGIFGLKPCRFEPRYDETPIDGAHVKNVPYDWDADDVRKMFVIRTYVKDVCVNCGRTVERETRSL